MFEPSFQHNIINKILEDGAKSAISKKDMIERELREWLCSKQRKRMIEAERYFNYEHDVLKRVRTIIGADGRPQEVQNLPNNRNIDNQYTRMVNQKTNYLLSKPLTVDTENKAYAEALKGVFDRNFQRLFKNVGADSINGGIGWLYVYYDAAGELAFKKFKPYEVLPFWKDAEHTELEFAVRVYDVVSYNGRHKEIIQRVEIYTKAGVEFFIYNKMALVPDVLTPPQSYIELNGTPEAQSYNWSKIPLIPFKSNDSEIPLLSRVKCLQDGINSILSDFHNNMQEDVRTTVLILKNYDGEDLAGFRQNLMAYGAIKVRTVDGVAGNVDTLHIEVNPENYKLILNVFQKALIENAGGYDTDELKSGATPNEMTIRSIFNEIELDSNEMEMEFQASLENLLWFINAHFSNTGVGDFEGEKVDIIFNRDTIVVESQVIADIKNSMGILSEETCVAQHPYTKDVNEEMRRKKREREETLSAYSPFPQGVNSNEKS